MELLSEIKNAIPAKNYSSDDVFETGKFDITAKTVKRSDVFLSHQLIYILSPLLKMLLTHIASHGYIVIAPKFYGFISFIWTPITKEIEITAKLVTDYITSDKGLNLELPEKFIPDLNNIALSGHSRGGKSAFALALDQEKIKPYKFKALIGVDPSAGPSILLRFNPKILTYVPRSFDTKIPVSVIGAALSSDWLGLIPPFAPYGCNHSEFFNESKPPSCYFLARDCGHCDMLDGWVADLLRFICKSGDVDKELVRKGFGGVVVAFLKAYVGEDCDEDDLDEIFGDPSIAPLKLDSSYLC